MDSKTVFSPVHRPRQLALALSLVVLLILSTGFPLLAQRHIKGQMAFSPHVGLVDNKTSLALGLEVVSYRSSERYFKIGYLYDLKYYPYAEGDKLNTVSTRLSADQHTLSFDYAPFPLYDLSRRFYLNPTAGLHAGFERVNEGRRDLASGRITNSSTALIGAQIGVDAEVFFTDKTALVLYFQQRYLPYSNVAQFHTHAGVGLRFTFFKQYTR